MIHVRPPSWFPLLPAALLGLAGGLSAQSPASARPEAWQRDPALVRHHDLDLTRRTLRHDTPMLEFELFEGRRTVAQRVRSEETRTGGFTWYGELDTDAFGYAALAVQDGAVVGVVKEDGVLYRVREKRNGQLAIYQCQNELPGGCGTSARKLSLQDASGLDAEDDAPSGASRSSASSSVTPESSTQNSTVANIVDIIVAWTQEAEDAAGGTAAIRATIDLAVLETNQAFTNSEIDLQIRCVYTSRIDYVESGSQATDLDRLQSPDDGFMDDIHLWRKAFGADAVNLFIANDEFCGRSYNMEFPASQNFSEYAFNLVAQNCATGYYAFAHEMGHTFGLDHDRTNANGTPSQPYAYGFWTPNNAYRTIMGLPRWGVQGTRIQYFSNPDLQYMGQVLGVPHPNNVSADASKALEDNRSIITTWKSLNSTLTLIKPACALGRTLVVEDEVQLGDPVTVVLADPDVEIPEGAFPVLVLSGLGATPNCAGFPTIDDMLVSMVLYQVGAPWVEDSTAVMNIPMPNVSSLLGLDINVQPLYFDLTLGDVRTGTSQTVTVVP